MKTEHINTTCSICGKIMDLYNYTETICRCPIVLISKYNDKKVILEIKS